MSDIVEIAAAELEQAIKQTAARDGIDLDDPSDDIFPKQREDYRAWMRQVLAVTQNVVRNVPPTPEELEAADEITRLRADNKALVEAMELIVRISTSSETAEHNCSAMAHAARLAIAKARGETK